jgi:phosphoserine phosphatase RsbU/P
MAAVAPEIFRQIETMQTRILIADDQTDVVRALQLLLKGQGYSTESVSSPAELLQAIAYREFDLILMDLNYARDTTSGQEGLDLLAHLKAVHGAPPIVVMTGWATVGIAVEAMQRGVTDFIEKPWANDKLLQILRKQVALGRERRELAQHSVREKQAHRETAHLLRQQELEIGEARSIQQGFLPAEIPQMNGYELAGAWQSARLVGGDYFDVLPFAEATIGLCIGDVAGKGMPAALLMSNLQAAVRGLASSDLSPVQLCARLNTLLCRNMASDRFITFFYAQLDGNSRVLQYVNAGHNYPIVMHRDGSHDRLTEGGGVFGAFPNQTFAMGTTRLESGDRVVFFTDGVTEASDALDEEFGEDRLVRLLEENRTASAKELEVKIMRAAADFCGGVWQDDATLLILTVA